MNQNCSASIGKIPIFFIAGRERTGTTLLSLLLDAHPNINIPFECPFVLHLSSKYGNIKLWDKKKLQSFHRDIQLVPIYNLLNLDKNILLENLLKHEGNYCFSDLCKVVYLSCESFYPKEEIRLVGDKNPLYSLYLPSILNIFPEAKIIYITRDYRDNICSMCAVDYESHFISSLAYRWKYYMKKILKTRNKIPDQFLTIKYEDLVSNPEFHLSEICKFLKVDYYPGMLKFYEKEDEYLKHYPKEGIDRYYKSLFRPITGEKIYSWKLKMKDKQVRIADSIVGNVADTCGYQRKYSSGVLYPALYFFGIFYGRLYFVWIHFIYLLPFGLRMKFVRLLAVIFKNYWIKYEIKKK